MNKIAFIEQDVYYIIYYFYKKWNVLKCPTVGIYELIFGTYTQGNIF